MTIARTFIKTFKWPLSKLLGAARGLEKHIGPDDDWVEDDRRYLFEYGDILFRPLGRPLVAEKGTDDWTYTVDVSPDEVEEAIHPKYERNLLSTRKYRVHETAGKQWADGSWVHDPVDKRWQHHIYIFEREDGGTDIYAHWESSVRHPYQHVYGNQEHGDPYARLLVTLSAAGIKVNS